MQARESQQRQHSNTHTFALTAEGTHAKTRLFILKAREEGVKGRGGGGAYKNTSLKRRPLLTAEEHILNELLEFKKGKKRGKRDEALGEEAFAKCVSILDESWKFEREKYQK